MPKMILEIKLIVKVPVMPKEDIISLIMKSNSPTSFKLRIIVKNGGQHSCN